MLFQPRSTTGGLEYPRFKRRLKMATKTGVSAVEFVVLIAIVGLWFALQAWILPAAGVPT